MSQTAVARLYLMQVGSMPAYQIPIVCYLVQTGDGQHMLIDSGLPERIPDGESGFANGRGVIAQPARIGVQPDAIEAVISTHYDTDHAGRHAAFTQAQYVVQRAHRADAARNPRYAAIRPQWDRPRERLRLLEGDTALRPGLELIETSGPVPGHQAVLVRLPPTGAVLLTIDAVPFAAGFTRDQPDDGSERNAAAIRARTHKPLDLVDREQVGLVLFGHDRAPWDGLTPLPAYDE